MQHVVIVSQNRSIKCDISRKHFKKLQYYAHVLSVSISEDLLRLFIKYLSQPKEMTLHDVALLHVKRNEDGIKTPKKVEHLSSQKCRVLVTRRIHIVNSTILIINANFSPGKKNNGCKHASCNT